MEDLRTTLGVLLMLGIAIVSYMFIPFIYIYPLAILISIIAMLSDYLSNDPKRGMIIYVLKWTTLIPVVNLVPLLLIPVFSIVNLFFKED